uniref:Similarity n=2 Tax=Microcystis aeruginosa (strain PCC 7806) TaxID=267872 RepID=A8YLH7_MICA7|nr:unnamed protein product [Microcystis aeruginosa PCC 7806]
MPNAITNLHFYGKNDNIKLKFELLLWKDSKMTKLQLTQAEIESLTFDEFLYLRNWINKLDDQQWEKQIKF